MGAKKTFLEGIHITEQLIHDIVFMCETRTKSTYFTRAANCKMDFKSLILFELNFVRKTLQLELDSSLKPLKELRTVLLSKDILKQDRKYHPQPL